MWKLCSLSLFPYLRWHGGRDWCCQGRQIVSCDAVFLCENTKECKEAVSLLKPKFNSSNKPFIYPKRVLLKLNTRQFAAFLKICSLSTIYTRFLIRWHIEIFIVRHFVWFNWFCKSFEKFHGFAMGIGLAFDQQVRLVFMQKECRHSNSTEQNKTDRFEQQMNHPTRDKFMFIRQKSRPVKIAKPSATTKRLTKRYVHAKIHIEMPISTMMLIELSSIYRS